MPPMTVLKGGLGGHLDLPEAPMHCAPPPKTGEKKKIFLKRKFAIV